MPGTGAGPARTGMTETAAGMRCYAVRRVNPFEGVLEVIALPRARAYSPNGTVWQVQVLAARPDHTWRSGSNAPLVEQFFGFGLRNGRAWRRAGMSVADIPAAGELIGLEAKPFASLDDVEPRLIDLQTGVRRIAHIADRRLGWRRCRRRLRWLDGHRRNRAAAVDRSRVRHSSKKEIDGRKAERAYRGAPEQLTNEPHGRLPNYPNPQLTLHEAREGSKFASNVQRYWRKGWRSGRLMRKSVETLC